MTKHERKLRCFETLQIALAINGKTTAELDDRQRGKALAEGVLAMPVIPEPMVVQYKDLRLKDLK